jgi:hypothetical protein
MLNHRRKNKTCEMPPKRKGTSKPTTTTVRSSRAKKGKKADGGDDPLRALFDRFSDKEDGDVIALEGFADLCS